MQWKAVGIIVVILLVLGVIGAATYKIIQRTEGYKGEVQNFHTFEPHFYPLSFGCANYRIDKPNDKTP